VLVTAGLAQEMRAGVALAATAIDSGAAERLVSALQVE
jgi:anthranilate phosphoribosyltransferase